MPGLDWQKGVSVDGTAGILSAEFHLPANEAILVKYEIDFAAFSLEEDSDRNFHVNPFTEKT